MKPKLKVLIDTNVIIGLEDDREIKETFSAFHRKCGENGVKLFVHEASKEDIGRDTDAKRRAKTLSKIRKFLLLKRSGSPSEASLTARFGAVANANDRVDVLLLHSLSRNAVDFLVTEDMGLHRRAKKSGLGDRVLMVSDALAWLTQTFEPETVVLPSVEAVQAYEIDFDDPIFDGLRSDYDDFDGWTEKCRGEHRDCWIVRNGDKLGAIVIRKDESRAEAGTVSPGQNVLKMCTFKVGVEMRGRKLGEQLLKQVLWHAQLNDYDTVYVTAYAKQIELIGLLEEYGFRLTGENGNGEQVFEKVVVRGEPTLDPEETVLAGVHRSYPRYFDGPEIRKFVIPIRPGYHAKLFPEASGGAVAPSEDRPGNTIKKVYLCNSPSNQLRPGDLLFFYVTASESGFSQTLATVGVIEQVRIASTIKDVRRWTAKRSVFSDSELVDWVNRREIKVIDFLHVGNIAQPIALGAAVTSGVLRGAPQSIVKLTDQRFDRLKALMPSGLWG